VASGDNVTRLHQRRDGKTVLLPTDWPHLNWVYSFGPAGGINSTVKDMAQWLRLHINRGQVDGKRLVSQANMDFLHAPATPVKTDLATGALMQYCQAWVYARQAAPYTMIWHNGDTTANHAMIAYMPGKKVGLVMLCNLGGVDMIDELARYFCDLYSGLEPKDYCGLYLAKLGKQDQESDKPSRPESPLPPQPLERYVGAYFNPIYQKVQVRLAGQGLEMVIGPKKVRLEMRHWNQDMFMAEDGSARLLGMEHEAGGLFTRVP
jgi:hypothetical protein